MGGYGFVRFSLPMFPLAANTSPDDVRALGDRGHLHLVRRAQTDMKKLIAYSSIAHMGFATMGILR
jgi:NADH-quinone oxidoreductase subunit M